MPMTNLFGISNQMVKPIFVTVMLKHYKLIDNNRTKQMSNIKLQFSNLRSIWSEFTFLLYISVVGIWEGGLHWPDHLYGFWVAGRDLFFSFARLVPFSKPINHLKIADFTYFFEQMNQSSKTKPMIGFSVCAQDFVSIDQTTF